MDQQLHLGDEVEIVTDEFAGLGAPQGVVGVVVDDWADGSRDVEVRSTETGDVVARFRAAPEQLRRSSGTVSIREPREHGILFGRGDALAADTEEPPTSYPIGMGAIQIPGYAPAPIAFKDPPPEAVTIDGEVPWELRD